MTIVLHKNFGLPVTATKQRTSTVGECNLANRGSSLFFTGNWYAATSRNLGANWNAISPFSALPNADGGFCCDQTLIYEPSRDIFVWLLQYVEQGGTNTLRVAVNPGGALNEPDWHWWDLRPTGLNASWVGEWFDYNHVATSNNYLYVATNVFTASDDRFTRAVLIRLPLDDLAAGTTLNHSHFATPTHFSLRCTQGAEEVMYFGSHSSTNRLRLFSWPENSNAISHRDIAITPWSRQGPYVANGPDGRNWLTRCDSRITGAAVGQGLISFAWTANASGDRPFPHIRVVRIDQQGLTLHDEPDIWNDKYAFAYAALCPNQRGVLGIALFRGGGDRHPGHVVGAHHDQRWQLRATMESSDGPLDGKWGDYLSILPYSGRGHSWLASGYTLQGGGHRTQVEPRVVQFYVR